MNTPMEKLEETLAPESPEAWDALRSEAAHRRAFAYQTEYLAQMPRGLAARPSMFSEYGVQLSRGFRALKVWMSLKAHGAAKYARLIEQNVE